MARECLKSASKTSTSDSTDVRDTVQMILDEIETGGDNVAKAYAEKFDRYAGNLVLSADEIAAAAEQVPQRLKHDIRFAHDNVQRLSLIHI